MTCMGLKYVENSPSSPCRFSSQHTPEINAGHATSKVGVGYENLIRKRHVMP